MGLGLG
jgi:hypothetical protein